MRNFSKNSPTLRAFTLMEMAIVIAIIGLLAGGIVAGRTYLRTAQLTTVVNDAKFYMSALNQFETKYNAVPGDLTTAQDIWGTATTCPPTAGTAIPSGTCNGDGNGLLVQGSTAAEYFYAFHHLAKAGLIDGTYSGVSGSSGSSQMLPGTNIPDGALPDLGYWFTDLTVSGYYVSSVSGYFDGYYMHPLRTGLRVSGNNLASDPYLTTKEAMRLDEKFDDTKPGTGWVRGPINGATGASTCTSTTSPSTSVYSITATGTPCWLVFTAQ